MGAAEKILTVFGPEVQLQVEGFNNRHYPCKVLGLTRGKLHVRAEELLPPGLRVVVSFAHIKITGEVEYCTPKDKWFRACIAITSENEQRRGPRVAIRENSEITALSGSSQSGGIGTTKGMIVDLSVSGMGLRMSHFVEQETMLFVETRSAVIAGEVRYCREGSDGWFDVGIDVSDILSQPKEQESGRSVLTEFGRRLSDVIHRGG
jgi:hypothetical protein